ncbi:hypothetical protein [Parabacteroides bouchesdurhonensis]|uniref:rolling circle replication-associated protein n=1 Tax=Parabacteroides bouchesdurhonensis TaxID=1936995 RepID=UPI0022DE98BD|nr:hypothetical protein [Parabacteroides bouchesdurhonensis]
MNCLHPIRLRDRIVPCGKCVVCIKRRRQSWAFRLEQESKSVPISWFCTLTYDDEHLTYSTYSDLLGEHTAPVVVKRDVQLFMKRLRRYLSDWTRIRFFLVAEYGEQNLRPHYHMILFGKLGSKYNLVAELLRRAWQQGYVQVSPLSTSHIRYCVKYMYKNELYPEYIYYPAFKPFMLCSRQPGIGYAYMSEQILNYYRTAPKDFALQQNGTKCPLPRYYKDKLYDDDMKAFIGELRNQYQLQGASANRDHWLHLMRTNPEMQFQLDMLVTEQKLNFEKYLENKKLYGKHF